MTHVTTSDTTQGDLRNIKQRLDELERRASSPQPPILTALPANPVDSQEIIYVADETNGIEWRLRYRAASASPFKWEFVGGNMWPSAEGTALEFALAEEKPIAGISMTVPFAGIYLVGFQCYGQILVNELVELLAGVRKNGVFQGSFFEYVGQTAFARIRTFTFGYLEYAKADVITAFGKLQQPVKSKFVSTKVFLQPIRVG